MLQSDSVLFLILITMDFNPSQIMWIIVGVSLDFRARSVLSRLRILLNFSSSVFFAVTSVYTVWSCFSDFEVMLGHLIPLTGSVYLVFESYFYMFRSEEFYRFNERMDRLLAKLNDEQKEVVESSVKLMPFILKSYLFLISIPTIDSILTPLIVSLVDYFSSANGGFVNWRYPFYLNLPFNSFNYSVGYIILAYGVVVACFMNYYDAICYGMCLLLRGHFKVLRDRCDKLKLTEMENKKELRLLIDYHTELLAGVAEFHRAFEPIGVIIFLAIAVIFWVIIFVITQVVILIQNIPEHC